MPNLNFSFNSHSECIIYITNICKTGFYLYDVSIDFRLSKDLEQFRKHVPIVSEDITTYGTIIRIKNLKSNKRLISGCYYNLNLNLMAKYKNYKAIHNSYIYCMEVDMRNMDMPINEESELFQSHSILNNTENIKSHKSTSYNPLPLLDKSNNLRLVIKDVKQGNWNELRQNDKIILIYDLGAPLHATKSEVDKYITPYLSKLQEDKPLLILSHWDMDHIHCLFALIEKNISKFFRGVVCCGLQKSLSSKMLYVKIFKSFDENKIWCLKPHKRTDGIKMHRLYENLLFSLYIGEMSRNINYAGLTLFINTDKTVSLTGDVRLIQANSMYLLEKIKRYDRNHILVVPHHGGAIDKKYLKYSTPCHTAIISVGENSYGHPSDKTLKYLESIVSGDILRTDETGDITIDLKN